MPTTLTYTPVAEIGAPAGGYSLNPISGQYRVYPAFLSLCFARSPLDGRLLAAACHPHNAVPSVRSTLTVWRFDDAFPEAPTGSEDIEASDVTNAWLEWRLSGVVDLFYIHSGALKHRTSQDKGATWSAAATVSLNTSGGAFTPQEPAAGAISGDTPGDIRTSYLRFCHDGGGNLFLAVLGTTPAVPLATWFTVYATPDAASSTARWIYPDARQWPGTPVPGIRQAQLLPDGIIALGDDQDTRLRVLNADGSFTHDLGNSLSVLGHGRIDAAWGQRLQMDYSEPTGGGTSNPFMRAWTAVVTAANNRKFTTTSAQSFANGAPLYEERFGLAGSNYRRVAPHCLRLHPSGMWEVFVVSPGPSLKIWRCRSIPNSPTASTWE